MSTCSRDNAWGVAHVGSGSRPLQRQEDAVMVPNSRAGSRGGSAPRDSSEGLASGEPISPRIVCVRSNTGETPGSRPLQRQEDAMMVPNSRACSRGGSAPRDRSGRQASGETSSPRIVCVRSNTGETPGIRPLQRQEDAAMVPNSRACSRGGSAPRVRPGSLASGDTISPRIVTVRSNTGETLGSRPLQRQEDAVMVPNSRACSRGGSAPRDSSGGLASGETSSPRIVSVRSNTGETPGIRPLQRQEDAAMVPNSRACSRGGSAPRVRPGSLASGDTISPRIVTVRSNTGETLGRRPLQRQEDAVMVPNSRACSRGGSAPRDSSGGLASGETISPRVVVSVRSNTGETPGSRPLQRQEDAAMVPNSRARSRGGSAPRDSSGDLASEETISPVVVSVRSHNGETPGSRPLQRQEEASRAERLCMQERFYSLPGSVPFGPPDGLGIVREPRNQEDTCHCSEHTMRHQKQSRISELNRIWDERKSLLADTALNLKDKQNIVRRMARTGTELVLLNDGRVGDVATGIGGTLVLPPLNVDDVKHHFGDVKGFPGISVLVDLIKHGVPVVTSATPTDPRKALQYGNHSSVQEHMPTVWEKLCEDVLRNRCLVFTREAAEKIVGLCVAPLGAWSPTKSE